MKIKALFLFFIVSFFCSLNAQEIFFSDKEKFFKSAIVGFEDPIMKKEIPARIIIPESAQEDNEKRFPVIYLLHGHGGDYNYWPLQAKPNLQEIADKKNIIFVSIDGNIDSWYWDSPVDKNSQYETCITKVLIPFIDAFYPTIKDKKARAITGLSMGGHGALWLGFRHTDLFGAFGSICGGVDIRPFIEEWGMAKYLGDYESNKEVWDNHTVINLVKNAKPNESAIIIDCGYQDFFYQVNEALHKELLSYGINHDYITREGAHNEAYWSNSLDYQILFFEKFFKKAK